MDDKYIELLVKQCSDVSLGNSMFIYYSDEIDEFVQRLVSYVKKIGIQDIYLDKYNIYEEHDFLVHHTLEEIEKSDYFDKSIWNDYAEKRASFLIFETEYPGVMDDVDAKKISLSSKIKRESRFLYRKMVEKCEIPWCIAAYPGKVWANDLYHTEDSYFRLKESIFRMCMLDRDNSLYSWKEFLHRQEGIQNYLNGLGLRKLYYSNSLGTKLELSLPDKYLYSSAKDNNVIVNMPSYEIFASPVYDKTEGIVYASKPLMYNGAMIEDFWLEFHEGKVVNFDAKKGRDVLESIIDSDSHSCYLGECALVEVNSPIAMEHMNFKTTLIDENASCHLALGAGFAECIEDGLDLSDEELLEKGINVSRNHVDFMIGTSDLRIEGLTELGEKVLIFKDGKFDKSILDEVFVDE